MKYSKIADTDFFKPNQLEDLMQRIHQLQPNTKPQWGTMTVDQMLHHLNLAIGSGLGYYSLADTSNFMSRIVLKYLILNLLQRFPQNAKTASTLKSEASYNFQDEKDKLITILNKAYQTKTNDEWGKHTFFGKMSRTEWGKLIMIHVHHHLQQFNA
jgi:hypothetical protein